LTEEERHNYAQLTFRKESLVSSIQASKARIHHLTEALRSVNREQDEWLAVFALRHDVDIDVDTLQVDIGKGVIVLS
jgi:hypothetical protein